MKNEKHQVSLKRGSRINNDDIMMNLGKLPPQVTDLEEVVLGALILEKNSIYDVQGILKTEYFYLDQHRVIAEAIFQLFEENNPIDMNTVVHQLKRDESLEIAGGRYFIAEITGKVSSGANIAYHSQIIKDQWIKRSLIRIGHSLLHDAYEDSTNPYELIDAVGEELFSITSDTTKKTKDAKTLLMECIEDLEEKKNNDNHVTGVPSGYETLDKVTHGFQAADVIIIAARPGMGKTALICGIAENTSVKQGIPMAIFSLEMPDKQLMDRIISIHTEIPLSRIRHGKVDEYEFERVINMSDKIASAPLYIDDTATMEISELKAKARKLVKEFGVKLIMIDYLQLMKCRTSSYGGNREQQISELSREIKLLAKELNIPIIVLSQLSRAVETRGGAKRPLLADLRESGSIEQDADMVIFLYRPYYYGIETDEMGNDIKDQAELIIAKHRNGSLQNAFITWKAKLTKFDQYVPVDFREVKELESMESHYVKINVSDDKAPF